MKVETIKIKNGRIVAFNNHHSIGDLIFALYDSLPDYPGKYKHWAVAKEQYLNRDIILNPCCLDSFEIQFGGDMCATKENILEYSKDVNTLLLNLKFEMDNMRPILFEDGEYCVSLHEGTIFMSK